LKGVISNVSDTILIPKVWRNSSRGFSSLNLGGFKRYDCSGVLSSQIGRGKGVEYWGGDVKSEYLHKERVKRKKKRDDVSLVCCRRKRKTFYDSLFQQRNIGF